MRRLEPGESFPDATLPCSDGQRRRLADGWAGAGGVLVVGHADCPTTRLILPYVGRLAAAAGNGRVRAILQDDPETAARLLEGVAGMPPALLDGAPFALSAALGLRTVPTLFKVSGEGIVERVVEGFDRDALETLGAELKLREPLFAPDERVPALRPG